MPMLHNRVIPYGEFTRFTPALPQFYWNVYSAEQRIKAICLELDKLLKYSEYIYENLDSNIKDTEELVKAFELFKQSGFEDYYKNQLSAWIKENMQGIIEEAIKMVHFGLTDDGYFVAYIPDAWSDIVFDTGAIFGEYEYGRLILQYDVDSPNHK